MSDSPAGDRYQVKFETLCLGNLDYRIRSLKDRQQFEDNDGAAHRLGITSANWPLFGQVWPSGVILAEYMSGFACADKRILEIGCGLALSSLVLQRRGADITASDLHPLAASFLSENLRLNRLDPIRFHVGDWGKSDPSLGDFDLIIGSDVLYERDQPAILSRFIEQHSSRQVEVIIVDPDRSNRAPFNRAMDARGYAHAEHRGAAHAHAAAYKGRILRYRRDLDA